MPHAYRIHAPGLPRKPVTPRAGLIALAAGFVILLTRTVPCLAATQTAFANSLWIGTDNSSSRNVLNMDRSGVLLRTVGPVECTGMAIDADANVIYFGTSTGGISPRDLTTSGA